MLDFFLTFRAGWSAILSFPFSWLLSRFHAIRSAIFLLLLSLFGSGHARYRGRELFAWILAQ
jgi:hypothetical protein